MYNCEEGKTIIKNLGALQQIMNIFDEKDILNFLEEKKQTIKNFFCERSHELRLQEIGSYHRCNICR